MGYFTDNELPLYPVNHIFTRASVFVEGRESGRSDDSIPEPSKFYTRLPMDKRLVNGILSFPL